jgi:hypothetical protein
VSLALLYPARALPPIFQNVFWPTFSSPWPFSYDAIFTTAFVTQSADHSGDDCRQSLDGNAIVERLRAEIGPNAEQVERLQRLGGAIAAAADYLAKACPTGIPVKPTARLQLMDLQIQVLTMAVDIIHQPLQDFEQSLTDEQRAKFSSDAAAKHPASARSHKIATRNESAGLHSCGAPSSAIDWSIAEIDKSVQPNEQQRAALTDVQQAFRPSGKRSASPLPHFGTRLRGGAAGNHRIAPRCDLAHDLVDSSRAARFREHAERRSEECRK